jgi:hypothetical protein
MPRFGEVGVALLDPFKNRASATTVNAQPFGSATGKLPTPSNPWSGGNVPGGYKPPTGTQYTFGTSTPLFGKPKVPAIQPPAPKPIVPKPPVIQVLPKPIEIPVPKPPTVTLPVVSKTGGNLSIVPAQGGGDGGGSAPAASGADSPVVTTDAPGLLSNPLVLGGLAVLAYLVLAGGKRR